MSTVKKPGLVHVPTITAIAVVAWCLFAVMHEIVGHGGAALLLGEHVQGAVTTTVHIRDFYDLKHVTARIGWWGFRTVAAAGTVVNLVAAAFAMLLLRSNRVTTPTLRYFLWLFATISIIQQAFWLAVMPFAGLGGDWTAFFIELQPARWWKAGVTGVGLFLLWAGFKLPFVQWAPSFGAKGHERRRLLRQLTVIPVATAFVVQMLSVLWTPLMGSRHSTIVAVFSFIPLVLWLLVFNLYQQPRASSVPATIHLERNKAWLVAGAIALILFVIILGPGVGSFEGHPYYVE